MEAITPVVPGFNLKVTKYAEHQMEYLTLPCHKQPDGTVTVRWKLTWLERIKILIYGNIWQQILTFNKPLQPVKFTFDCPVMGHTGYDEEC